MYIGVLQYLLIIYLNIKKQNCILLFNTIFNIIFVLNVVFTDFIKLLFYY